MRLGKFNLISISDGKFFLDGGAMFGIVPKVIWSKLTQPDELNRIELGLNPLLIQFDDKNILVDTGIGDKFDENFIKIYKVDKYTNLIKSLSSVGLSPKDINVVINTHLHFDHCGGNTIKEGNKILPTFTNAKYVIQKFEWDAANNTNERTRASYLSENFEPIEKLVEIVEGDVELFPGIKVVLTGGHTIGHQCVIINSEEKIAIYLGDLVPTTAHIKLPYIMGYDLYPLTTLEKRKELLGKAIKDKWLLIFEHDPKYTMGYIKENNELFDLC